MIWFTSDTHFGHTKVLEYDKRPFATGEEHDNALLANHNSVVSPGDHVYHLGDVSFSRERVLWWLKNANGYKHLIRGNHDDKGAWPLTEWDSKHEALYLRVEGQRIYLSHYACRTWRNSGHGSFHLYGHSHGGLESRPWGRSMDVGVMCHNYFPVSLDTVVERLSAREIHNHLDHHEPTK